MYLIHCCYRMPPATEYPEISESQVTLQVHVSHVLVERNCPVFLPLQHKKLAEGSAYEEVPTSAVYSENDISNSIKNGILYLEDPINHVCIF